MFIRERKTGGLRLLQAVRLHSLFALTLLLASSVVAISPQSADDLGSEIARLEKRLQRNPDDLRALGNLGVLYFQTKQFAKAEDPLRKSAAVDREARMLCYYGMTLEAEGKVDSALTTYANYSRYSPYLPYRFSQYRKLMEGRYRTLTKATIQTQMRGLVVGKDSLKAPLSLNTIAVFPFDYLGTDERFFPLGRGLSERMINDLGQVASVRLVERTRIQSLFEELKFAESGEVDSATAPRLGRLLGAGRIVAGTYNVSDRNDLRIDITSWNVTRKGRPKLMSNSDTLDNLFWIEKYLAFSVLKDMGVTPTTEEIERIQRIPTKNLQAFTSYCRGLESEDEGYYKAAGVYYKQATSLDPSFSDAQSKVGTMESLEMANGSIGDAWAALYAIDPPAPIGEGTNARDLVLDRLQNLGRDIGVNMRPGLDSRTPAEEAVRAGAAIGDLPAAPLPPNK